MGSKIQKRHKLTRMKPLTAFGCYVPSACFRRGTLRLFLCELPIAHVGHFYACQIGLISTRPFQLNEKLIFGSIRSGNARAYDVIGHILTALHISVQIFSQSGDETGVPSVH